MCHIPHIHKVIAAFPTGREPPHNIIIYQLYQVIARTSKRPQYAGRVHYHGVQPLLYQGEYRFCRFRFGFGISAGNRIF